MNSLNSFFSIIPIVFIVIFGLSILGFIFTLITIFSSKARAKMMGKQVKAMKYVYDENEKDLEHISTKTAEISSPGVEITARAIKKGITEDVKEKLVYCKHCGKEIEVDSKFCKYCGKEQ